MKKHLLLIILISIFSCKSKIKTEKDKAILYNKESVLQEIEIPLNTKLTLQVVKINDTEFSLKILNFEPYLKKINFMGAARLFLKNGDSETLDIYFCETKNNLAQFIIKSRSKYNIKYKLEIQTEINGVYYEQENVGTYAGAITSDSWQKIPLKIKLSNFEINNN